MSRTRQPGQNRSPSSFPAADEDYFHDMDGAISLTSDEIKGRNMWIVWTGGDDKLWDTLGTTSLGTLDFSKHSLSAPGLKASRANRWHYLGLVNDPVTSRLPVRIPNALVFGSIRRDPACGPEPFENENKYPGVKIGARGKDCRRFLLWLRQRSGWPAPLPQSGL